MKKCSKCNIKKSLTEFNKNRRTNDGARSECRSCQKEINEDYYIDNKVQVGKKCKIYRQNNKEECQKRTKEWERKNPLQRKVRFLKYRHTNLKTCRARNENYRLRNMDKDAAKAAKRRSSKIQRTPLWLTEIDFIKIKNFYTEANNLSKTTGIKHHVDHKVPLQGVNVCGLHVPWNLQVITAEQNLIKSNKF